MPGEPARCLRGRPASTRPVTPGSSQESPAATARTARWRSSAGTPLSRKPAAPARSAPARISSSSNVVRTSTGGDPGTSPSSRVAVDAVDLRHAHVHDDHVGAQPRDGLDDPLAAVELADDVEAEPRPQDAAQTGAHQLLVVHQQHPHGVVHGVVHGAAPPRPATRRRWAPRSGGHRGSRPAPASRGARRRGWAPGPEARRCARSPSSRPAVGPTCTTTGWPGACRVALVSASCTIRYAASPRVRSERPEVLVDDELHVGAGATERLDQRGEVARARQRSRSRPGESVRIRPTAGAHLLEAVAGQPLGLQERTTRLLRVLVEGEPGAADVQQGHRQRVADDVVHLGGDPVALLGPGPLGQLVLGLPSAAPWRAAGDGRRSSGRVVNEVPANQAPHPGSAVSMTHSTTGTRARTAPEATATGVADVRATQAVTTHNPIQHRFDDCAWPRNTRAPAAIAQAGDHRPARGASPRQHDADAGRHRCRGDRRPASPGRSSPRRGRRTARARLGAATRAVRSVMGTSLGVATVASQCRAPGGERRWRPRRSRRSPAEHRWPSPMPSQGSRIAWLARASGSSSAISRSGVRHHRRRRAADTEQERREEQQQPDRLRGPGGRQQGAEQDADADERDRARPRSRPRPGAGSSTSGTPYTGAATASSRTARRSRSRSAPWPAGRGRRTSAGSPTRRTGAARPARGTTRCAPAA